MSKLNIDDFRYDGTHAFKLKNAATKIDDLYDSKSDYEDKLEAFREEMDQLQSLMYAHDRYGLLIILQAMDAAGKDGTIKHVLSGVNPVGVNIKSFKRPSEEELDHDYMWRHFLPLPMRGTITIFNRSYYEEVLVAKVHPEIVTKGQHLPDELKEDMDHLWQLRYDDMVNFEQYLFNNGIRVVKIFLNVSQKEQGERLIERINDTSKNWKFEEGDVTERGFWSKYMKAYEEAINATATKHAPWYVIPADGKKNMRLLVGSVIISELNKLKMNYPETSPERQELLKKLIQTIEEQDKDL